MCAVTVRMLSILDGALHVHACACMRMYAATVRVLSRRCFGSPGINYLRTMNAVTVMAFKFLLRDFDE